MSETYATLRMFAGKNIVAFQPAVVGVDMLETLSVDLEKGTVETSFRAPIRDKATDVLGIIGILQLEGGSALAVITGAAQVASLPGLDVFKVTATEVVAPIGSKLSATETRLVSLLKDGLDPANTGNNLYFSYGGDITLTIQRTADMLLDSVLAAKPVWARADERFFWNRQLSKPLTDAAADRFVLTLIMGFVEQEVGVPAGPGSLSIALIARRSVGRAGCRHWRRGADREGRVANFVESEVVVLLDNNRTAAAHVQVRGSIPLLWTQIPNIKYKPPTKIAKKEDGSSLAFEKHMAQLVEQYKAVIAVNLVNQKGSEGKLETAFKQEAEHFRQQHGGLKYVAFDFHHQCGSKNYHRMSILWDQVKQDFASYGFFLARDGVVESRQSGVVRVNCIDCLDRTNVVQGMVARKALEAALRVTGVLGDKQEVPTALPQLEQKFKVMFADHGDAISQQYAGTGALKSGFTRTGKRTIGGLVDDGVKSVARYYINNFLDGRRQDAVDLVTGNFSPKTSQEPLFSSQHSATLPLLGAIMSFCWAMIQLAAVLRSPGPAPGARVLQGVVLPVLLAGGLVGMVVRYGKHLVDRPRLCPQLANTLLPLPK